MCKITEGKLSWSIKMMITRCRALFCYFCFWKDTMLTGLNKAWKDGFLRGFYRKGALPIIQLIKIYSFSPKSDPSRTKNLNDLLYAERWAALAFWSVISLIPKLLTLNYPGAEKLIHFNWTVKKQRKVLGETRILRRPLKYHLRSIFNKIYWKIAHGWKPIFVLYLLFSFIISANQQLVDISI